MNGYEKEPQLLKGVGPPLNQFPHLVHGKTLVEVLCYLHICTTYSSIYDC